MAERKAPRYIEAREEMPYGMTLKVQKRILGYELAEKGDVSCSLTPRSGIAIRSRGKS